MTQPIHYPRQLGAGYCAAGSLAVLVSLVDPKAKLNQKALTQKYSPTFNGWGTTNEQFVSMVQEFFGKVTHGRHTTWKQAARQLKAGKIMIIDFWDDTTYQGDKFTPEDGHNAVITHLDLNKQTFTLIDSTYRPKLTSYQDQHFQFFDAPIELPFGWLNERWHDTDINGQPVIRWAMFVDPTSYKPQK